VANIKKTFFILLANGQGMKPGCWNNIQVSGTWFDVLLCSACRNARTLAIFTIQRWLFNPYL